MAVVCMCMWYYCRSSTVVQLAWTDSQRGIRYRLVWQSANRRNDLLHYIQDWLGVVPQARRPWQRVSLNHLECHGLVYYPWIPSTR